MTNTQPASQPPAKLPLTKVVVRRVGIAVVLLAVMLVPFIVLMAATKQPSASYAAMGAIIGAIGVAVGGLRFAVIVSIVTSLLAPLSIIAGLTPLTGAILMAVMALAVGRMSRYGLHRAALLVPVFLAWPMYAPVPWVTSAQLTHIKDLLARKGLSLAQAVSLPPSPSGTTSKATQHAIDQAMIALRMDQKYLAWVAGFFFIGSIVAAFVMHLMLRKVHLPVPAPTSRRDAVPYTITIVVLTAIATYYFLDHPKQAGGAFLIATILVLTQVGHEIAWKLTVERVLGTFGGIGLLLAVMAVVGGNSYTEVFGIPIPMHLYAVGLVFGMLAIATKFSPRLWIYYMLLVPTTALLNAYTTAQVAHFGRARLVDNVVGAVAVIVAALIALGASKLVRSDEPAVDTPPAVPAPT